MFKRQLLFCFVLFVFSCEPKPTERHTSTTVDLELDIKSKLGEGAFWNHQTQTFWWIDIEGKALNVFDPSNKKNISYDMKERIGTVVPDQNGNAMVALQSGVYSYDFVNKTKTLLVCPHQSVDTIRLNDGKCDPQGRLWVGSMHLDQLEGKANLYCIDQGKSSLKIPNVTISNGICWSKDQKTMFYIDTPSSTVKSYDFNPESSEISNGKTVITIDPDIGYPDGMTIDENDHLWIGLWNGNAVGHFDPNNGKLIKLYPIPAHNVSSCAFGGVNLDVLYITSARVDMTQEELEKYPNSGSVFSIKPGVKGLKQTFYKN